MIQSVFKRKEIKYIITAEQRRDMLKAFEGLMHPDEYGVTCICNTYFDTPNYRLVRESVEKPTYKEKLRLRTYGVPEDGSPAFVELKKKLEGIVYKRREILPYSEAYDFLVGHKYPSRNSQIMNEIAWVLDFYEGLSPAMALFYERTAYAGDADPELRMTLDTDLKFRTHDFDLRNGAYGEVFMDRSLYIMEIKILNAMPLWMSKVFDELEIYPHSYSKYGTAYTKLLTEGSILQ